MTHKTSTPIARLAIALVGIALMTVAFLRGNYLLGFRCGIIYALVAAAIVWLFAQSFTRKGKASRIQMISVVILAVPVGYAMAFPATINSDVQYFIDDQATDRTVRAELKHVFESDAAFADLSISTTHLKVVNVAIYGALPTRDDFRRLRRRINNECPTLELCPLHWDIRLRDTNEHIDGLDRDLFSSPDETA